MIEVAGLGFKMASFVAFWALPQASLLLIGIITGIVDRKNYWTIWVWQGITIMIVWLLFPQFAGIFA